MAEGNELPVLMCQPELAVTALSLVGTAALNKGQRVQRRPAPEQSSARVQPSSQGPAFLHSRRAPRPMRAMRPQLPLMQHAPAAWEWSGTWKASF
jgi:hypothetical protein